MSEDILNEAISVVEKLMAGPDLTTEEMCEIIETSMDRLSKSLRSELEAARQRIAELESAVAGNVKLVDPTPEAISWAEGVFAAEAAKDARIASLEAALKPFAEAPGQKP